ncbi:MAG TPA: flavodoxin FldA [Flavobacteriaceae bacterium]|jgi:flavodoxin I|nr:flavodoxin FldA [Flavobacteriaceae bacterium]HBS12936.1 flavodoxin FldA [Flavobacteriaceae bacterium]
MKIGLFYGSDTGNTEEIAQIITTIIGEDNVDIHDIRKAKNSDIEKYEFLILGCPTWYDGELQSDWEDFFPNLDDIDFTGKTVALFGLGDQYGYGEWFVDGIGIIYDKIIEKGAKVVGEWPTDDYDFDESVAERDGKFVGLALDEDNESEKTEERIDMWLNQISHDFGFEI